MPARQPRRTQFIERIFPRAISLALLVVGLAACGEDQRLPATGAPLDPTQWAKHGRTDGEERYSPLDQIREDSVADLGLAWFFDTGTKRGLEATPLMIDGVLYVTGSWSIVFALDARTGELLWRYDPQVPGSYGARACCDVVNRGVAYHEGKIYVGSLDGRLIALEASSGNLIWEVLTVDPLQPYTVTGAPRVVDGKVVIGNGGAEYGVRGYVSAFDADTGTLLWRFYTVPGDPAEPFESEAMRRAAETWTGQWWRLGGGGTVWDSLAYDPDLGLLYVGTGNGSPWNRYIRSPEGGDNLYLSSILALDPKDGSLVWHYQTTPADAWDYTATQHMILTDLEIEGETRSVIMQAPKNGFFYVLDRETGEFLSAAPYAQVTWALGIDDAGRPIEAPAASYRDNPAIIYPSPLGAHTWQPMSYNPNTKLVYIPVLESLGFYQQQDPFTVLVDEWNTATNTPPPFARDFPPSPNSGFLVAWDPATQSQRWRVPLPIGFNGGTLTTAGNLVFQGTADGRFVAYAADTGEKLWESEAGTGVVAAPITYELDGIQYVTVLAGWGGAFALINGRASIATPQSNGRLLSFALNRDQTLPSSNPPEPTLTPIAFDATPASLDRGLALYNRFCSRCHGLGAVSSAIVADLRKSSERIFELYDEIVLDGAFVSQGMPGFAGSLRTDQVAVIRDFVLSQRQALIDRPTSDQASIPD